MAHKIKAIPAQALRFPGGWGSQISWQLAHEGGKFVSLKQRQHLHPGNIPGTHFCYRLCLLHRAIVLPEGLCQWKIPTSPSGIEPATSRLVAQCLNQLRHRVALWWHIPVTKLCLIDHVMSYFFYEAITGLHISRVDSTKIGFLQAIKCIRGVEKKLKHTITISSIRHTGHCVVYNI